MKDKHQGKLKQHISILIGGQATPILSYSIREVPDPYCGKQRILTLKSLIKSAMFSPGLVGKTTDIVIPTDTETLHFCGYCSGFFNGVPLLEMTFQLIENNDYIAPFDIPFILRYTIYHRMEGYHGTRPEST